MKFLFLKSWPNEQVGALFMVLAWNVGDLGSILSRALWGLIPSCKMRIIHPTLGEDKAIKNCKMLRYMVSVTTVEANIVWP